MDLKTTESPGAYARYVGDSKSPAFETRLVGLSMSVAEMVKHCRTERGLTQEQLAEATGMFGSAVNRIENPHVDPAEAREWCDAQDNYRGVSLNGLCRLARAMDLTLTVMLEPNESTRKPLTPAAEDERK